MLTLQTKGGFAVIMCHATVVGVFAYANRGELKSGLEARDLVGLLPKLVVEMSCKTVDGRDRWTAQITVDGYVDVMESWSRNTLARRMAVKYPGAVFN